MTLALRVLAVCLAGCVTATAVGGTPWDAAPPVPLPGARGTVRTVLQGTTVEELPIRFLGTLEGALGPGLDLYLVELEGPVGDSVGIAAGMSGSPVTFDGTLFGALSYRLGGLPRRAIGGVTRIDQMRAAAGSRPGPGGPVPIGAPLAAAGLHPEVRAWLAEQFRDVAMPVVAVGGGGPAAVHAPLEPGSAVGVALLRGDVDLAATGTVTAIDGDVVLAFGHPFLGTGRTEAPMVNAEIVHTLADAGGSFKISNLGPEIGAILDDRLTAVAGVLGRSATMIPVELSISDDGGAPQEVRFELVRASSLAPVLAGVGVANAVLGRVPFEQKGTALATATIALAGRPEPLRFEWAASGAGEGSSPALQIGSNLQRTLETLYRNPFHEPLVERVRLEVVTAPQPASYRIEAILLDRRPVRPGETLRVACDLVGWRGGSVRRDVELDVPAGLTPGTPLVLAVGAASEIDRLTGDSLEARLRTAGDFDSYVGAIAGVPGPQRLVVALLRADGGVVADGAARSELPLSVKRLASSGVFAGPVTRLRAAVVARTDVALDGPIGGVRTSRVVIR